MSPTHELVVIAGPAKGARWRLGSGTHVVGRGSRCDVSLDDEEVSRRHFTVTIAGSEIHVADLASTNGTYVDGAEIEAERLVAPGQTIEVGGSILAIQLVTAIPQSELPAPESPWRLPFGTDDRGEPVAVDLAVGHLLVIGPYKSGRSTLLSLLAAQAERLEEPPDLRLLAPRRSPLTERTGWTSVGIGRDDVARGIASLGELVASARKTLVFVDDAEELDSDLEDFETLLRSSRDSSLRFVIAFEATEANRTFGGWLIEARKQQHGVLLRPDPIVDGELLGVELPASPRSFEPATGYLVSRGVTSFVRVADVEQ